MLLLPHRAIFGIIYISAFENTAVLTDAYSYLNTRHLAKSSYHNFLYTIIKLTLESFCKIPGIHEVMAAVLLLTFTMVFR